MKTGLSPDGFCLKIGEDHPGKKIMTPVVSDRNTPVMNGFANNFK